MRLLYLLFAIYVFGLSLTTCTDGMYQDDCGVTGIHLHAQQADQHTDDECCSPFCVCACCSGVVISKVASLTTLTRIIDKQVLTPVTLSSSADPAPIWQPPKLS